MLKVLSPYHTVDGLFVYRGCNSSESTMTELKKTPRNINEWYTYLNAINPNVIKLGLERVRAAAERLGVASFPNARVVEIAGTNGKGSTAHMVASVLCAAGIRTGLYTSPHILRFSERIMINGVEASNDELCTAFELVLKAEDPNEPLTFFEFTTLAAFLIFKSNDCEVLVLEVGLGGRLDAVNILDADIAVIPSIGLDHCKLLGNTLHEIATEKAGIIKPSTEAVIAGELDDEALDVIRTKCQDCHAVLHESGRNMTWKIEDDTHISMLSPIAFSYLEVPTMPLINAPLSFGVIQILRLAYKFHILDRDIIYGFSHTVLHGRFERISHKPEVIIDVAHNPPAAAYLSSCLRRNGNKRRYAVTGMLKDKDINATLSIMAPNFEKFYVCPLPGERGAGISTIVGALAACGVNPERIECCLDPYEAYERALNDLPEDGQVIVFGSFVTVEKVLEGIGGGRF